MKVLIKIIVVVIGLCILTGTVLVFFKDIKILFTRESAAYLSDISDVNHVLSVSFFIVYLYLAILVLRRLSLRRLFILLLVLLFWLMSGRVVAFKSFPDGRVITGWYYVEANSFKLCKEDIDCESMLFKETKVTRLPFWCISIDNSLTNKIIFIGPFTWNSSAKVFEDHIGK